MLEQRNPNEAIYRCLTCDVEFRLDQDATPVCCPVCRMNRLKRRE